MLAQFLQPIRRSCLVWSGNPDRFLRFAGGVVHVGANSGQERDLYALFDLPVLWVEPIAEVFRELQANIAGYPQQRAV
ncbi:MAG: hypothetical protein BMS9Abin32_108 [Gammaproteobacteria bacterium]|nr:MAG: hypothetical protein BMS9Abin32_108 [Gammaproteobacteria bacterium]